ncbi:type II secretion system protein [Acetivibrio ethanolgignens]|uniref:Pilin n=1 Tax=Acetivibrio ethanolgignens TaxID=290052 RepID=A0A0V8QAL9_9FIRM|nr:prepilin-type N-terminal cleavage/methylation domain-containing protein [Acetivibrio ethanolgignens]KSV57575.1 hypothetical protein ASU35_15860 [Acetivibrio ethanolgignens]
MEKEIKKEQKLNNKGFSLVELIIVIAIMAILVGVVGTQVIPYMNSAREAKDEQVISSIATAAVTAVTECAEDWNTEGTYTVKLFGDEPKVKFEKKVQARLKELTYSTLDNLKKDLKSTKGGKVTGIEIKITKENVTVTATDTGLEPVITTIGQ